ncbi:MAG: GTPase [Isosphaeraceae bacterium]
MVRIWRAWVLVVLFVGPILAYMGFGALWLLQRGWLLYAGTIWVIAGVLFAWLSSRWTRAQRPVLPPIDWDAPRTFAQVDRDAWRIVEEEAEAADTISMQGLTELDVYVNTGRKLAARLAAHYHPLAEDPIERVPLVDLLTAIELAAEDLNHLCRQVPGGDMITPDHWKKAVKMAGLIQRANDLYSYLLPIFSPVNGLVRLGTQQLMSKPAWRDMQQNLLRWFFAAYVNRLGTHLIELYSGRLAIGAETYRRLTRRKTQGGASEVDQPALRIAVAGARESGKSRLIALIDEARRGDPTLLNARLDAAGIDRSALARLRSAEVVEIPGYTASPSGESARDRSTRRESVERAADADLLVLVIDARRPTNEADVAFASAWDTWFVEHPNWELPPALAVLTGIDEADPGLVWQPPYDWQKGQGPREEAARARLNGLRTTLPPSFLEVIPVGLPEKAPFGVAELVLPTLIVLCNKAERTALIRHLQSYSRRSKAGRLISQVGERGRSFWRQLRGQRQEVPSNSD